MGSKRREGSQPARCRRPLGEILKPRFFKALADPNRIALLDRLTKHKKRCSVSEMAECCPVNLSGVSRHLAMLKEAGVLKAERKGKEVYYTIDCREIISNLREMAAALEASCGLNSPKKAAKGART